MTIWNNINSSRSSIVIALVVVLIAGLSGCANLLGDEEETSDTVGETISLINETENDTVTASDGSTYSVGYDQVSSNNQDPYVIKRNADGDQIWGYYHDTTDADAKAVVVALDDSERPYVAFTIDGGRYGEDRFQERHIESGAFSGAPFPSFGAGGNKTVSVIARLDPDTGRIERGTFLVARLTSNNETNSMAPQGLDVSGTAVFLDVNSYAWPPGMGATQNDWNYHTTSGSTPLSLRYTFPLDLTELSAVQSVSD